MDEKLLNSLIEDFTRTIALNYREAGGRTPLVISFLPDEQVYYGVNGLNDDKISVFFRGQLAPEKDVEVIAIDPEETEKEINEIFHKVGEKDE